MIVPVIRHKNISIAEHFNTAKKFILSLMSIFI